MIAAQSGNTSGNTPNFSSYSSDHEWQLLLSLSNFGKHLFHLFPSYAGHSHLWISILTMAWQAHVLWHPLPHWSCLFSLHLFCALLSPQLPACLPTQQACSCLRTFAYASLFPGVSSSNISTLCILTFLRSLLTHTGFSVGCSLITLLSTFPSPSFPALSFFRVFLTTWSTISLIFLFCCCLSPSLGCELHEDRDSFSLLFCAVYLTPGTAPGN